jgi:hypothetical protein
MTSRDSFPEDMASCVSRPALCLNIEEVIILLSVVGPTQPPLQWVPGALSVGVKRPGREADGSSQLVPGSKIRGFIPPLHRTSSWLSA